MTLEEKAQQIRLDVLKALGKADLGEVGLTMSLVEILVALYYGDILGQKIVRFDSARPGWDGQDYVILSQGNLVPLQYAILADLGFFDKAELDFLAKPGSLLKSRPNMKIPGVTATLESDAYGLSFAAGLALALSMDRRENRVFVVVGESELRNGRIWETSMTAAHYNLDNLVLIVNSPFVTVDTDQPFLPKAGRIVEKFAAFGWETMQVTDGHDFDQLLRGFDRAMRVSRRPVCLWAHTISGKGIEFAERKPGYLRASLSESELTEVILKLQK